MLELEGTNVLTKIRRAEPPTEKEVLQSLALAQMKKINAAKLEEQRRSEMLAAGLDPAPPGIQDHEKTPYPKCNCLHENCWSNNGDLFPLRC